MCGGVAIALADVAVLFVQHGVVNVLELLGLVSFGVAARVVFPGDACEPFGGTFFQESVVPILRACFAGSRRGVGTGGLLLELVLQVRVDCGCVNRLRRVLQQGIHGVVLRLRVDLWVRHGGGAKVLRVEDFSRSKILSAYGSPGTTCGLVEGRGGSPIATITPYPYWWSSGGGPVQGKTRWERRGNVLPSELVCRADHVTDTDVKGVKPNEGLTRKDGRRSHSARCPPRQAWALTSLQAGSPSHNPEEEEWGQRRLRNLPGAVPRMS